MHHQSKALAAAGGPDSTAQTGGRRDLLNQLNHSHPPGAGSPKCCSSTTARLRVDASATLRGRATSASWNTIIVLVRLPNVLALFVRAGGSPRPRHSALALQRGVSASRNRFNTPLRRSSRIQDSTGASMRRQCFQDPTARLHPFRVSLRANTTSSHDPSIYNTRSFLQ